MKFEEQLPTLTASVIFKSLFVSHAMLGLPCELFASSCHSLPFVHVLFQVMAVDIQFWAQSLARWPLRTIQAPTPVTPGASGGFDCQRGARCNCCLEILTLRAVQAAEMALL